MVCIDKTMKPMKFIRKDFKRWQKRMIFLLKTLKIFYAILMFEDNIDDHRPVEKILRRMITCAMDRF